MNIERIKKSMKTMERILREELKQIDKIVDSAEKRLKNAPEGCLRILKKRGGAEYYYKGTDTNNRNGRYLKKKEVELAKRLAQRDYDKQIVKAGQERGKAINDFLKKYEKANLKDIYAKTSLERRELIQPFVLSDEEYIKRWKMIEYRGKPFENNEKEIFTENGERVRSKSEKIIADKLYALGIPYRYEYPIVLENSIKLYPDFTILRMPQRQEVYLEHFGMMDDVGYVEMAMHKLSTYEKNGIYLGVNLFLTYETGKNPLNTRAINELLQELFCCK